MKMIGAGVGRTGTTSLKIALEQLTGKPCFHMVDLFNEPEGVHFWQAAADQSEVDWLQYFSRFGTTVDWPSAAFWPELMRLYPGAKILLSQRPAEDWWHSASNTIFPAIQKAEGPWRKMMDTLLANRFTTEIDHKDAAITAYLAHNKEVVESVPADRLIIWQPGDGWEPLCKGLECSIPENDFPHVNTAAEYRERARL